jgi:hypothetical protein
MATPLPCNSFQHVHTRRARASKKKASTGLPTLSTSQTEGYCSYGTYQFIEMLALITNSVPIHGRVKIVYNPGQNVFPSIRLRLKALAPSP